MIDIADARAVAAVNARSTGAHTETPLHWAASSDDVEALDALLDAGADIEAAGAVIAGGTPLDDAVAFAQWHTARRLVERGAYANLFNAAGLPGNLSPRSTPLVAKDSTTSPNGSSPGAPGPPAGMSTQVSWRRMPSVSISDQTCSMRFARKR
jgi:Ankyrin repeat